MLFTRFSRTQEGRSKKEKENAQKVPSTCFSKAGGGKEEKKNENYGVETSSSYLNSYFIITIIDFYHHILK